MALTETQAIARVSRMCQATLEPQLDNDALLAIVRAARRVDTDGNRFYPSWEAEYLYQAGELVAPTTRNGSFYIANEAGLSGETEPEWPTEENSTVDDGAISWTRSGADLWVSTYDLNAAAAEGWLLKAGKAVHLYNASAGASRFDRAQIYKNCVAQANNYARKVARSVRLRRPEPSG